jgi:methanethiol S-methyltransferase
LGGLIEFICERKKMSTAPWLIFATVILYGAVHSLLASLAVKEWVNNRFGPAARRGYRLAYNIFAVVSLLPVLALVVLLPDNTLYVIPFPWSGITLIVQILAVLVLFAGVSQTGLWSFLGIQQVFQTQEEKESPELVLRGLYRCVRHPLYTAGLFLLWLSPVMTANLLALAAGFSLYIVIGAVFEERKLVEQFGEAYQRYQKEIPMLLPCVHMVSRSMRRKG